MKFIPFAKHGPFYTRALLLDMVQTSPGGQSIAQMRDRLKVLEAIENAGSEGVTLEDAQHATLLGVINGRADFVMTSAHIIAIIDSVEQAKAPPNDQPALQ